MSFVLGFFSGMFFLMVAAFIVSYRTREKKRLSFEYQERKDALLLKALPLYSHVRKIFQEEEIEPQKMASLIFLAKLIEEGMDQELAKEDLNSKIQ